jgi:hypothetical protein
MAGNALPREKSYKKLNNYIFAWNALAKFRDADGVCLNLRAR